MITLKKYLMEATGIFIIVLAFFAIGRWRHPRKDGKIGVNIDGRLKESKAALEKAAARVERVVEHIKNRK